jgi:hypothetical protein
LLYGCCIGVVNLIFFIKIRKMLKILLVHKHYHKAQ